MADLDPVTDSLVQTPPSSPAFESLGTAESAASVPADVEASSIRSRLLEIAADENRNAAYLAALNSDFNLRAELLNKAVPELYLKLVKGLRESVRAFNASLKDVPGYPPDLITWYESPSLALRDVLSSDGIHVRVSRKHNHFDLLLRAIIRAGKADIPLIEGHGALGRERVLQSTLLRIEGWVENGTVRFFVNLDFKRQAISIEEIPDRIVMAVAKADYKLLSRSYVAPPARPVSQDSAETDL